MDSIICFYDNDLFDSNSFKSYTSTVKNNDNNFWVDYNGVVKPSKPTKYERSTKGLSESASAVAEYMNEFDSYVQQYKDTDTEGVSNLIVGFYGDPSSRFQDDIIKPNADKIDPTDLKKITELYQAGQNIGSGYQNDYTNIWNQGKQYYLTLAKIFAKL